MKHVRLVLVSIALSCSWIGVAEACTCAPFIGRGAVNSIVVSGTIEADVEAGVEAPWWDYSSRLVAEKVWFGPHRPAFQLIQPYRFFTTCGSGFVGRPGDRVIAWLHPFGGEYYSVGLCSVVGWENEDRQALEVSLGNSAAAYDQIDRRLRAAPEDSDLWRARFKIATDIKDIYGRLLSLKRLVDLARTPDPELLKDAATTADAVYDSDAAAQYAARGLGLSPGDDALKAILHRATLRRAYSKESLAATKELHGATWTDQHQDNARIELIRLWSFQIQRSTFDAPLIDQAQLLGGTMRDVTLGRTTMRNSTLAGVLMRKVSMNGAYISRVKVELGKIDHGDFSNATLDETSIETTSIADTPFRNTKMTKVKFAGGALVRVNLSGASLAEVAFEAVLLEDIDFTDVELKDVRFTGVALRNVDISRVADLQMKDAVIDCRTKLPAGFDLLKTGTIVDTPHCGGKPNNRDFTSAPYADRWVWAGLDLTDANFAGVDRRYVYFTGSVLRGANFSGARIGSLQGYEVDFRDARFIGATIGDGIGGNVDFRLADLRGTDFSGANLTIRYIVASPFRGAKYDARTKWPATFLDGTGKPQPFNPAEHGATLVKD